MYKKEIYQRLLFFNFDSLVVFGLNIYFAQRACVFLRLNTFYFSLDKTRDFCSFQVTPFVVRKLFIKMKSYLLEVFIRF